MTNTNTAAAAYTVSTAHVTEGLNLAILYRRENTAAEKRTTASISTEGFDTRLGALLAALREQATSYGRQRTPGEALKAAGVSEIPKQRRSEALWLHDNRDAVQAWIEEGNRRFGSVTAVKKAFDKAHQPAPTPEAETEAETETETGAKESRVSDPAALATTLLQSASSRAIAKQAADLVLTMIREEQAARRAA